MKQDELKKPVQGIGSIIVYNAKTDKKLIAKKLLRFFFEENCDKCVPCREGVLRIAEMLEGKLDKKALDDIFFALKQTSLCPLGKCLVIPLKSLFRIL